MDADSRVTFIKICELLKGHHVDLAALDRSFYALFQALRQHHPDLEQQYLEAAGRNLQKENLAMRDRLEKLDELLQELRKG